MAEDNRTFRTSTPAANRSGVEGLGAGPFDRTLSPTAGDDHGGEPADRGAGDPSEAPGDGARPRDEVGREARPFADSATRLDDRNAAGLADAGDLGAGTPAGVDVHDLGQEDKPEEDGGEDAGEGLAHSANPTRRGIKSEAERGQGAKTRRLNKDIISRRS